ncbi:ABC transporter ATP-binding protein [Georgenia faecalis]|uniref:ABC transporter ATP-binding protein n=1 Tax=Georgenia faecalis TaxID=2483799 RepID=A0ABV9D9Q3_9MICO|nr:ATP-binding cassette domain-containing protein [Georgenia faecalis]
MTYTYSGNRPGHAGVEARGLVVRFGSHRVLDGVDLTVPRGGVLALLGPNGAGKTTAVRVLTTVLRPQAGSARVAGADVVREAARVRERIGVTGQEAAVDGKLTGRENLLLMARLRGLTGRDARRRADALLEELDLVEAADRLVERYSGGMRRRVDLAASLLGEPEVLFLDEPTTGLDPRSRQTVWDLVRATAARGTSVLLTTQYLEEADRLADAVAVLDGGRIVAEGTAADLKGTVGEAFVELVLEDASTVRVPTDGSVTDVRRVLGDVLDRRLDVVRWQVRTPTLDEVFLELTAGERTGAPR